MLFRSVVVGVLDDDDDEEDDEEDAEVGRVNFARSRKGVSGTCKELTIALRVSTSGMLV